MNIEKIFEARKKELKNIKDGDGEVREKRRYLTKLSKIAAVLTMFMMPQVLEADNKNKEDKSEAELKIEDARILLSFANDYVNQNAKEVKTLNGVKFKELELPSGKNLRIADDGKYAIVTKEKGSKAYFDENCDGKIDRVVINQGHFEENDLQSESEQRMMDNNFYFFDSIDNLKEMAKVESTLKPKPVQVVFLDHENKSITVIDSEDGTTISSHNGQGKAVIENLQSSYAHDLKEVSREVYKK